MKESLKRIIGVNVNDEVRNRWLAKTLATISPGLRILAAVEKRMLKPDSAAVFGCASLFSTLPTSISTAFQLAGEFRE